MALTPVEQVRLLIGLTPNSPFYNILSDEEIEWFLEYTNGDIIQAAKLAAISVSFQLSGTPSRERTGDLEIWSNAYNAYRDVLDDFIKNPAVAIPANLLPWSSSKQLCNLTNIEICDGDECISACSCQESICTCNCAAGETF